jgi:hypothetical protein
MREVRYAFTCVFHVDDRTDTFKWCLALGPATSTAPKYGEGTTTTQGGMGDGNKMKYEVGGSGFQVGHGLNR